MHALAKSLPGLRHGRQPMYIRTCMLPSNPAVEAFSDLLICGSRSETCLPQSLSKSNTIRDDLLLAHITAAHLDSLKSNSNFF